MSDDGSGVGTVSGRARKMATEEDPSAGSGRVYRPQERLIVLMLMEEAASTGTV